MQRISVKKHCRNVPLHAPISHLYPPVCCGIQPLPSFLMRLPNNLSSVFSKGSSITFEAFSLSKNLESRQYSSVHPRMICQNKITAVGVRFLFRLLKREASTRKFALRAREIRLAAASQAGGRSAANLRTGLAVASVRHGWLLQNKSTPVGVLLFWRRHPESDRG